jgi:hypothetical protein
MPWIHFEWGKWLEYNCHWVNWSIFDKIRWLFCWSLIHFDWKIVLKSCLLIHFEWIKTNRALLFYVLKIHFEWIKIIPKWLFLTVGTFWMKVVLKYLGYFVFNEIAWIGYICFIDSWFNLNEKSIENDCFVANNSFSMKIVS